MVAGRRDSMACRQVGKLGSAEDGNSQNLDFSSKVIPCLLLKSVP